MPVTLLADAMAKARQPKSLPTAAEVAAVQAQAGWIKIYEIRDEIMDKLIEEVLAKVMARILAKVLAETMAEDVGKVPPGAGGGPSSLPRRCCWGASSSCPKRCRRSASFIPRRCCHRCSSSHSRW